MIVFRTWNTDQSPTAWQRLGLRSVTVGYTAARVALSCAPFSPRLRVQYLHSALKRVSPIEK
jgi:hypothetical protein